MFVRLEITRYPHFRHAVAVFILLVTLGLPSAFLTPSVHARTVQTCTQEGSFGGCGIFVTLNNGNIISGSIYVSNGNLRSFGSFIIFGPNAAPANGGAVYETVEGAPSTFSYTAAQTGQYEIFVGLGPNCLAACTAQVTFSYDVSGSSSISGVSNLPGALIFAAVAAVVIGIIAVVVVVSILFVRKRPKGKIPMTATPFVAS